MWDDLKDVFWGFVQIGAGLGLAYLMVWAFYGI